MSKGILLDDGNDLKCLIKKDAQGKIVQGLVISERKMQDAYIVLKINQGEAKNDPIVGANLLLMIRRKYNREKVRKAVEIALQKVGIRYDEIKEQFGLIINKKSV